MSINVHSSLEESKFRESPIFTRSFVNNPSANDKTVLESTKFSVMTYNILADCYAQLDFNKKGSWISKEELSLANRHRIFMEELKCYNADIICLQEVGTDYFENTLKPCLKDIGYDGILFPRVSNDYKEGEATFYKSSKFRMKSSKGLLLAEVIKEEIKNLELISCENVRKAAHESINSYAVSLLTRLESLEGGFVLSVANVHIAYDKFERQDKQCLQISATVRELQKLSGEGDGQIICGDFNSWPSSPPQQLMNSGSLNIENKNILAKILSIDDGKSKESSSLMSCIPELFQFDPSPKYESAYEHILGSDPYTSRFSDGVTRQVDFLYFSDVLKPQKVLSVPDKSFVEGGIPNSHFPSDHLSLMAEFAFK